MRILLIGNGGREHAICRALSLSPTVERIFTAPGNPGTAQIEKNRNIALGSADLHALATFASTEGVDLTVVGPEGPLADGIVDRFRERRLDIFGPSKEAARLESSKQFAKEIMAEAKIPTASFQALHSEAEALAYLRRCPYPVVLKADGLAAGKGVAICPGPEDARRFVTAVMGKRIFGDAGATLVAEEFLEGEEVSFLVIADGTHYIPLVSAQDHKRLNDGERGPNTGGMGAYSPAPIFDATMQKLCEARVVRPLLETMAARKNPFSGVLYVGLMITPAGPKVLEFNVRFGDPETQVILPRLTSDLAELLLAAARRRLIGITPTWTADAAIGVVLALAGYPAASKTGATIEGLAEAEKEAFLFHAGTRLDGDRIVTSGGRVLTVTALAPTLKEAAEKAYRAADRIRYDGKVFRNDIGWRVLRPEVRK
ncbi:MAG: phosphoribosylamine--glycine ligase [Pseudomonadota bacterium]